MKPQDEEEEKENERYQSTVPLKSEEEFLNEPGKQCFI